MASTSQLSEYENDPRLFLFTSLTAGSSHIITATSRMETILKANRIPFQAIDLATDEKARRLWQRRAQKKKLPGLVKDGFVLGDLEDVEEWSEFGELKENIGSVPSSNAAPAGSSIQGVNTAPAIDHNVPVTAQPLTSAQPLMRPIPPTSVEETRIALPGAAEIAALAKAKKEKESADKVAADALLTAQREKREIPLHHPSLDHLSAPASAIHSGTATPKAAGEPTTVPDIPPTTQDAAGDATKADEAVETTGFTSEQDPNEVSSLKKEEPKADENEGVTSASNPQSGQNDIVERLQESKLDSDPIDSTQKQEAATPEKATESVED